MGKEKIFKKNIRKKNKKIAFSILKTKELEKHGKKSKKTSYVLEKKEKKLEFFSLN